MKHVDIDLIQLVAQRILPPHAFARAMFEHLNATCAECRRAFKVVDEATEARLFGEGEAGIQAGEAATPAGVSDAPVWKSARFANQFPSTWLCSISKSGAPATCGGLRG